LFLFVNDDDDDDDDDKEEEEEEEGRMPTTATAEGGKRAEWPSRARKQSAITSHSNESANEGRRAIAAVERPMSTRKKGEERARSRSKKRWTKTALT